VGLYVRSFPSRLVSGFSLTGDAVAIDTITTMQPLLSNHFNLRVEMPLKAIVSWPLLRYGPLASN